MQKKIINKSFLFLLLFLLAGGKMVAQQTLIDVKSGLPRPAYR